MERGELHLHTNMSQYDGIPEIKEYMKKAIENGMEALAITDHGNIQAFPQAIFLNNYMDKFGYNKVLYIDDNKLEEARLKILYEITNNCLKTDITYFSGFRFYRKNNIWQEIINYNKKVVDNKYIQDYLEIENTNPGCEMIIESIEYFMNKNFKIGLTLLDKIFSKEYSIYENKIHEIEKKIDSLKFNGERVRC